MKNKKGYTLIEILAVTLVIALTFLFAIPIVTTIINNSKLSAFETSASSVIDSVDYYIAKNKFVEIPIEGLEIENLDKTVLKNNNFDSGLIIKNSDGKLEFVYLIKDKYCIKGVKGNFKSSSTGCGKLDNTKPTKSNLFLKNSVNNEITIVAGGYDEESSIVKYEISIDGSKYKANSDSSYNVFTFKLTDTNFHSFKVRVTNEAGLSLISEDKLFSSNNEENIICIEDNNLKYMQLEKNITCSYSKGELEYSYNYSNWFIASDKKFNINSNQKIYTRLKKQDNSYIYNVINISNIDSVLNGAYPDLLENMIPVIYNYEKRAWVVANKNITYWNYSDKLWANTVLVNKNSSSSSDVSKSRDYYLSNQAIGEVVYEKDILGFYVWIPRYKYKLWNINGKTSNEKVNEIKEIEIKFESKLIPKSTGLNNELVTNNEWLTHQAFSYNEEINGFWVSKYEASISDKAACYNTSTIDNCNKKTHDIYFNQTNKFLTNISIGNAHTIVLNMNKDYNIYGLKKLDNSHLLTNLEWGSIAYLSHSLFGLNNNILEQTTTGNETGVYNMGINDEMVMANYNKDAGYNKTNNSEFKLFGDIDWPTIYIDYYNAVTSKSRILGDATLESEKWYSASNNFVNGENPFMVRGKESIFSFNNFSGGPNSNITFRSSIVKSNE